VGKPRVAGELVRATELTRHKYKTETELGKELNMAEASFLCSPSDQLMGLHLFVSMRNL
jgi:hypothetical protein